MLYGSCIFGYLDHFALLALCSLNILFIGGSLTVSQDRWLFDSLAISTYVLIKSFGCWTLVYGLADLVRSLAICGLAHEYMFLWHMKYERGDGRRTIQAREKELESNDH